MDAHELTPEGMKALKKLVKDGVVHPDTLKAAEDKWPHFDDGGPVGNYIDPSDAPNLSQLPSSGIQLAQAPSQPSVTVDPNNLPIGVETDLAGNPLPLPAPEDNSIHYPTQGPAPASDQVQTSQAAPIPGDGAPKVGLVPTQQQAAAQPAQDPFAKNQDAINQGFDQQKGAWQSVADNAAQAGKNNVAALDQTVTDLNALQASWQKKDAEWHQTSQDYINALNDFTKSQLNQPGLDPHRYLNNLSTGGKIAGAISLALGGLAGGVLKTGGNVALDIINRNIDRDIEAQKFAYEQNQNAFRNKVTMYGMMRDQFNDDRNADMMTRSGMLEIAKLQLQKQANQTQSVAAQAQARAMMGQLQIQQSQVQSQIYRDRYLSQAMAGNGGSGIPGAAVGYMGKDFLKSAVRLPNGNYAPVLGTDKNVEDTQKAATKYDQIQDTLNQMQQLKDDNGRSLPLSEAKTKANALAARLAPMLNEYYGINRLSDTDFEHVLKPQIPDSTSLFQDNAQTRIDTLRSALQRDHDIMLKHNVVGYNPVSFRAGG